MDVAVAPWARRVLIGFFVLFVVFLYAPMIVLAIFSFNDGDVSFPLQGFTTEWYRRSLSNPSLLAALQRSAIVGVIASALAVGLGVLASFALLRRRFAGKAAVSALLFSPLVVPYLVFGISLLVIFTAVDKLLVSLTGSYIGLGLHAVVIGHVVVALPFAVLTIMPLLERLSLDLEEVARDLGATALSAFRRVTLPLLAPALLSAFLVSLTLSFDEYAIASFLVGTEPTWPVYLFGQLRVPSQLPSMLAVSTVVLAASLAIVLAAEIGRRFAARRYGDEQAGETFV